MKDINNKDKAYRTYDNRRDENEMEHDERITRSDLNKQPYHSAYGRELSEQMEAQRRINSGTNAAQ